MMLRSRPWQRRVANRRIYDATCMRLSRLVPSYHYGTLADLNRHGTLSLSPVPSTPLLLSFPTVDLILQVVPMRLSQCVFHILAGS